MPLGEKKERKQLSAEERKALKARQEELRRLAIKAKAKQFYRMANMVAIVGAVVALASFFRNLYNDEGDEKTGYLLVRQVLETGRAFESTGKKIVRSHETEATFAQHMLALVPIGLIAMLVLFLVDMVDPLGGALHVAGMLYGVAGSSAVFWVSFWQKWPGVVGGPLVPVLLGLFIMFVGCMASLPGAIRRIAEREGGGEAEDTGGGTEEAEASADSATAEDTGAEDTGAEDTGAGDTGAEDTGAADVGAEDTPADSPPAQGEPTLEGEGGQEPAENTESPGDTGSDDLPGGG